MRFRRAQAPLLWLWALVATGALAACGDDDDGGGPAGQGGGGQGGGGQGGRAGTGGGAGAPGGGGGTAGAPADVFSDLACGGAFCWQLQASPSNDFHGVAAVGSTVFAVGAGGTIVRRKDDVWKTLAVPGAPTLQAAWAAGESDLWVVGHSGYVARVDGAGVTPVEVPTTENLWGVWGTAPNDLWVVGEGGTLLHYDGATWKGVTEVDYDGGSVDVPHGALYTVWGTGPNDVWVGGGGSETVGAVYHFDGSGWVGSEGFDVAASFLAISGSGSNDVWGAGSGGAVYRLSINQGPGERIVREKFDLGSSPEAPAFVRGLVVRSPTDAWAFTGSEPWHWDGGQWTAQAGVRVGTAVAVAGDAMYSVGVRGQIYRLDTQGAGTADLAPGAVLRSHVASDTNGLAIGDFDRSGTPKLRRWDGTSWTPLSMPAGAVFLGGTRDGNSVLGVRSGLSFTLTVYEAAGPTTLPTFQVTAEEPPSLAIGGTSKSDLWAAVGAELWHFDGASWQPSTLPALDPQEQLALFGPVSAFAPNDVWVGGGHGLEAPTSPYVIHYNGASWEKRLLPGGTLPIYRGELPWLTAFGPDEAYASVSTGVLGSDLNVAPELYRWAAGAWQKIALPDIEGPAPMGSDGASVAARGSRLYVGLRNPYPGAGRLLVREGEIWSRIEAPVFGVGGVFPTESSLWVEDWSWQYLEGSPEFGLHYGGALYFGLGSTVDLMLHDGSGLLRLR